MLAEQLFRKLLRSCRNVSLSALLHPRSIEEDEMRKFGLMIAAIGALAVAVPSIASAETVVIKRGGHHHHWDRGYGAYGAMRHHDRGWHRGWHHGHSDRTVVIKRSHRY